jgi:DNA-binding IclR family transcriptional regulator
MIVAATPTELDSLRLRNEFLEMPGLTISVPQVARMLGLRSEHAAAILETLARERFLAQTPTGSYRRAVVIQRGPSSPFAA